MLCQTQSPEEIRQAEKKLISTTFPLPLSHFVASVTLRSWPAPASGWRGAPGRVDSSLQPEALVRERLG